MKSKKIVSILIGVIFTAVVLAAGLFAFTVKRIEGKFTFTDKVDAVAFQNTLDKYSGGNLLFFNADEMIKEIESDPYFKVTAVEKKFPNVVEVSVTERREVYLLEYSGKTYITDQTGFVLAELTEERKNSADFNPRDFITLKLDGNISVKALTVGDILKTDCDDTLATAFVLAKEARLTDCIKDMTVRVGVELKDVVFVTYTGVSIEIQNLNVKGVEKARKAVTLYDEEISDYVKTFDKIIAYEDDDNEVEVIWTSRDA